MRIDLSVQSWQHGRIAHRVWCALDRPDLHRLEIDLDVQLAELAPLP
jgi:hypothetical protein